uniref:Uncharacterized protein n=1 Tax=viral metagenome TaxID=1070528 RepID=A0A6C0F220_9ZZZZ
MDIYKMSKNKYTKNFLKLDFIKKWFVSIML